MSCSNDLISLDPACNTLEKVGGVKKKVWVVPLDNIQGWTESAGVLTDLTLVTASPPNTLVTYKGRKEKNNGAYTGEVGENTNTIKQDLNLVLYAETQDERNAVNALFKNTLELVVFVETQEGAIEVWGYDTGLLASALTGGTGTLLNDPTGITVTLSGSQDGMARIFDAGSLAASIAILDALV